MHFHKLRIKSLNIHRRVFVEAAILKTVAGNNITIPVYSSYTLGTQSLYVMVIKILL